MNPEAPEAQRLGITDSWPRMSLVAQSCGRRGQRFGPAVFPIDRCPSRTWWNDDGELRCSG